MTPSTCQPMSRKVLWTRLQSVQSQRRHATAMSPNPPRVSAFGRLSGNPPTDDPEGTHEGHGIILPRQNNFRISPTADAIGAIPGFTAPNWKRKLKEKAKHPLHHARHEDRAGTLPSDTGNTPVETKRLWRGAVSSRILAKKMTRRFGDAGGDKKKKKPELVSGPRSSPNVVNGNRPPPRQHQTPRYPAKHPIPPALQGTRLPDDSIVGDRGPARHRSLFTGNRLSTGTATAAWKASRASVQNRAPPTPPILTAAVRCHCNHE